jgi:hypothetical protein
MAARAAQDGSVDHAAMDTNSKLTAATLAQAVIETP